MAVESVKAIARRRRSQQRTALRKMTIKSA
jgi:hypothetical protein